MLLLWDDWNIDHIAKHGVVPEEAQEVVASAKRPFPKDQGNGKFLVRGRTAQGRFLQVIFVYRSIESVDLGVLELHERLELIDKGEAAYVIHARELRAGEIYGIRKKRS